MKNTRAMCLLLGVLGLPVAGADYLSTIGPVYPITEKDFLADKQAQAEKAASWQAWQAVANQWGASLNGQPPAATLTPVAATARTETKLPCTGKVFNPLTDLCWDCFLPISLGHVPVLKASNMPDTPNPPHALCACPHGVFPVPGVATGYWEPIALVDVVRTPFCMASLGGVRLPGHAPNGTVSSSDGRERTSFFHVHVYRFPRIRWLSRTEDLSKVRGHLPVVYMSEFDPTWNDSALAQRAFPETARFADKAAQLACGLDALSASTGLAQDALFWCAGAQGTLYPLTGHVSAHVGGVQASVLLVERVLFKLHQTGLIKDSGPGQLCGERYRSPMPKSRYRYQQVYPVPTTNTRGCQPFGRSTALWEALYPAQETPLSTENYVYLVWRKRNFCAP